MSTQLLETCRGFN